MADSSLEIADSVASFEEATIGVLINELPGFCIRQKDAKNIGYEAMAGIIDENTAELFGVTLALGESLPQSPFNGKEIPGGGSVVVKRLSEIGAHADRGRVGLAMHANKFGKGIVRLATSDGSVIDRVEQKIEGGSLRCRDNPKTMEDIGAIGTIASMQLENGLWTIFSTGNVPGLMPTVHDFRRSSVCSFRNISVKLSAAQQRSANWLLQDISVDSQLKPDLS